VPSPKDWAYQEEALVKVSRTFALTIPQLPSPLREVVGNAYLLCRIADTIEDSTTLSAAEKRLFSQGFSRVIEGSETPEEFASALAPRLEGGVTPHEVDLVKNADRVLRITQSFSDFDRQCLARCVRIMSQGMAHFQEKGASQGLQDQAELDSYCYYVAGVVGEMLTELFCAHSPTIAERGDQLRPLAVSFGQGLQMTNILKDLWDDKRRNVCWLPRSLFSNHQIDLEQLSPHNRPPEFEEGLLHLIGVTVKHLENAVRYTLLIPKSETGVRRFCLWAIGLAILTLRKIYRKRDFKSGDDVKVSRRTVYATIVLTEFLGWSNSLLRLVFWFVSGGLPRVDSSSA